MDFYQQPQKSQQDLSEYDIIYIDFQGTGNPCFEHFENERESFVDIDIASIDKEYLDDFQQQHDDFVYYKVEMDDSIFGLELKFEVSAVQILRMNNISENSIYPGSILKIPLKKTTLHPQKPILQPKYLVQYITQVGAVQGEFTIHNNHLFFEPDKNCLQNLQLIVNANIRDIDNLQLQILLKHIQKVESQNLSPILQQFDLPNQKVLTIHILTKKFKIVVLKFQDQSQLQEVIKLIESVLSQQNQIDFSKLDLKTIIPYHFENEILKDPSPTQKPAVKQITQTQFQETKMSVDSELLTKDSFSNMSNHLPFLFREQNWACAYSSIKNGSSIQTLLRKTENKQPLILLIKDLDSYVFGAYLSDGIKNSYGKFYGTGESFLFTFRDSKQIQIYKWTHLNNYFILCDKDGLAVGCGDKYGLFVNSEISSGYTCQCDTFNNDILSKKPNFVIDRLEICEICYK